MDTLKGLLEITPKTRYEPVLLPREVKERLKSEFGVDVVQPVDALCDLADQRWVICVEGKRIRVVRGPDGFTMFEDRPRHYRSTRLPTLREPHPADRELLLKLYSEVCSGWRMLTDVRFKLLGLVPALSIIAWIQLRSASALETPDGAWAGLALSLAGLAVTVFLRVYDLRNDELYDDLISRGRKIEEELGVDTALFRGRPRAIGTRVNHSVALDGIYGVAILGWVAMALWFISRTSLFQG